MQAACPFASRSACPLGSPGGLRRVGHERPAAHSGAIPQRPDQRDDEIEHRGYAALIRRFDNLYQTCPAAEPCNPAINELAVRIHGISEDNAHDTQVLNQFSEAMQAPSILLATLSQGQP